MNSSERESMLVVGAPVTPARYRRRSVTDVSESGEADPAGVTMYERVGGDSWFATLVDRFYAGVAEDPVLLPLYPDDLGPSKAHLTGFLIQYWGGPSTYSEERGHPRLRMRHAPFAIGVAERDAWFGHMAAALRAGELGPDDEGEMLAYFEMAATHLVNAPG
jgi:hemoglobin